MGTWTCGMNINDLIEQAQARWGHFEISVSRFRPSPEHSLWCVIITPCFEDNPIVVLPSHLKPRASFGGSAEMIEDAIADAMVKIPLDL